MLILIWLLTFLLMLDCVILVLLVLIQLPKKEAGMGQAFGGTATDALFGAGSGNALTKMTKYAAGIFFALTLLLSMMHGHAARSKGTDLRAILSADEKLSAITASANKQSSASNNAAATAAAGAAATTNTIALNLTNLTAPATNAAKGTK